MRLLHKLYAFIFGYFWLPCPKCGRYFGGHEKHGGIIWNEPGKGVIMCDRHTDDINSELNNETRTTRSK